MFCEKCGKEMPDDAVACVSCGRAVNPINAQSQPPKPIKRANTVLILSALIGGCVLSIVGFILIAVSASTYNDGLAVFGGLIAFFGVIGIVFGAVLFYMYIHRMWRMIQDAHASTTPDLAVGFLFVMLFNFYWVFRAFWGWSKDYNSFIRRNTIPAPRVPEGLFLTFAIMCASFPILGMIPFLNIIFVLSVFVVQIIMIIKMCKAINFFASRSE